MSVRNASAIIGSRIDDHSGCNLTGAGMGAKSAKRRNFESGFVTMDPRLAQEIMAQFDRVWMGAECQACQRKQHCADYLELLTRTQAGSN